MQKLNVWFNHWFSTVINSFDYLRGNLEFSRVLSTYGDDFECKIYTTTYYDSPVMKEHSDYWQLEPVFKNPDAYVDWCISFIKEHDINVFFARRCRYAISKRKNEIEALGCKVIAEDFAVESLLSDKEATYKNMMYTEELKSLVPEYRIIKSAKDFYKAWEEYRYLDDSYRFCIKKAVDEGALSFCELVKKITYKYMMDGTYSPRQITFKDYVAQLEEKEKNNEKIDTLMMMPYLRDEISCDCLQYGDKFICITRKSGMNHSTIVSNDKKYYDICKVLYRYFKLTGIANIQFRHDTDGTVKLLEINTRISGGMHKSCEASGVNLPMLMINKAFGDETKKFKYRPDFKGEIVVDSLERSVVI